VNLANDNGATPLSTACYEGHPNPKLYELLLACEGIDVNAADKLGKTPLMHACNRKHISVVEVLLAFDGIDVNAIDEYNNKIGGAYSTDRNESKNSQISHLLKNSGKLEMSEGSPNLNPNSGRCEWTQA